MDKYETLRLGFHLSIGGSIDQVFERAANTQSNTFQMFSRNPRGWRSTKLDIVDVKNFRMKLERSKIWPVFVHTPYLLNLASPKQEVYLKSVEVLKDELLVSSKLGIPFVVTHLGSHVGSGKKIGFERIVKAINDSFSSVENRVILLLENTAGTKNSMGSYLEDIETILSRIEDQKRVGVCFDTCHAFAAGYDLVSRGSVEKAVQTFDEIIGFEKLKLIHLNDSKGGLGSRIDRHEHIGFGKIGESGFRSILKSKLRSLPLILETPIDERRDDIGNLEKVRELAQE